MAYHHTDKPRTKKRDMTKAQLTERRIDKSCHLRTSEARPKPSMPTLSWITRADDKLRKLAADEQKPVKGA